MALYLIPEKEMRGVVARHQKVQARLVAEADDIGIKAQANLAGHVDEGHLRVYVERDHLDRYGSIDWMVTLEDTDSGRGEPAISAIEFGWGNTPGLYILSRAAGLA